MNGNSVILLDTNVVLYHLSKRLKEPLKSGRYAISSITELELLSYPKISVVELQKVQEFIEMATVIELKSSVKQNTITLRKKYSLKLPDAIIAGTALWLELPLLTNDKKLLGITEITTHTVDI
ncbi:MAG: type II toxin-antitoxin system VapC family toxin [Cyanobacteria bacterium P01_G01_bin.39]